MAVNEIWRSESSASAEDDLTILYYDDVNQAVRVQCSKNDGTGQPTGGPADGHGTLTLNQIVGGNPVPVASVNTDQFNDGAQHVLAGPGATGVDTAGKVLPTGTVAASTVAQIIPQKGKTLTASVDLTWHP